MTHLVSQLIAGPSELGVQLSPSRDFVRIRRKTFSFKGPWVTIYPRIFRPSYDPDLKCETSANLSNGVMQEVVDLPDKNALKRGRHGRRKAGKSRGGSNIMVGIFCSLPVGIGLTDLPKYGAHLLSPPRFRQGESRRFLQYLWLFYPALNVTKMSPDIFSRILQFTNFYLYVTVCLSVRQ